MRVALYSSKKERCGIATYAVYLENALRELGAEVRHWGSLVNDAMVFSEIRSWSPEIFHVQYEQAIMPPHEILFELARERRRNGGKNVATLHSETPISAELGRNEAFNSVLIHRLSKFISGARVFPMPCPRYAPSVPRAELRKRYGLSDNDFVVSTVGFLLPWKKTEEIVARLIPWLVRRENVVLQVIASEHFNPDARSYARACRDALSRLSASVGGRIKHVSHYPSDEEVLERLALSDIGYAYCPENTASASAAASLFISARCPLVTSNSTHYDHLIRYAVRAPKESLDLFARAVVESAENPDLLLRLRQAQELFYAETNYLESARRHLRIYGSC